MIWTRLALLWSVGILVLCLIPGSQITPPTFLPFSIDKGVHGVMFVGFGALWLMARPGRAPWVLGLGAAFGLALEGLQGLLPIERSPDLLDALADLVGLGIGVGLAAWVQRRAASNE